MALAASGVSAGAVIGQPLDFTVQVRTDPGEPVGTDCLDAEVTLGDRRLPASQVRATLEPLGADAVRIRVLTTAGVDEPVVGIQIHAGCNNRISRRYVVLADPPVLAPVAAAAPAVLAVPAAPLVDPLADSGPRVVAAADFAPPARDDSTVALPLTPPARTGLRNAPLVRANAAAAQGTGAAAVRRGAAAERGAAGVRTAAASAARSRAGRDALPARRERRTARAPAPVAVPVATRAPVVTVADTTPRLRLEAAEPPMMASSLAAAAVVEQALEAVAQAASATRAAASAASAAEDRIATLERAVSALRSEARASQDMALLLRDRADSNRDAGRWLWPLIGALMLLLVLATWLALRLAAAQREKQRLWMQAASALKPPASDLQPPARQVTAPIPFVTSEVAAPPSRQRAAVAAAAHAPAWPAPAPVDGRPRPWPPVQSALPDDERASAFGSATGAGPLAAADTTMERTQVLPFGAAARGGDADTPPRDVSIEELIDLEQQAEFFVVLGQDEAAIDLLLEHLRQSGGSSPLPYLKLLEIHRRRGDHNDYERTRTRFNQRFNAYAPEWGVDLMFGRTLEDYPGVIPRLQQVWPRPLDAMAELEALLFRRSHGDLFDLPAYREVLFLYSLSRDLLDREAADSGAVDLLLPLADGGEFSSTAPAPFLGLAPRESGRGDGDDRPTAPVDFDLSAGGLDRPTSIFDPLDRSDPRS